MSVSNGQNGDAPTFNGAFVSKTEDSITVGKVTLNNPDSDTVVDVQNVINENITAIAANTAAAAQNASDIADLQTAGVDTAAHLADQNNPHNVTPAQVGNETAQWNADKLQGRMVSADAPAEGDGLKWNDAASQWEPGPVASTGGGTNFIEGGDGESGLVGTAIGSGNVIASTVSPLNGTTSFLLTPSGTIGDGWEFDCEVPLAKAYDVVQGELPYQIPSGTYVDDDCYLEVLDPSSNAVTLISGEDIKNILLPDTHRFRFQTVGAGTYKVRVRQATTSTAYTLKFEIGVGPQITTQGAYAAYLGEKTTTGSWTTNTTYTGKYHRTANGWLEADVNVSLSGAPNSTSLFINLPAGLTIDTDRLSSTGTTQAFGKFWANDSAANQTIGLMRYHTTASLILVNLGATSTYVNEPTLVDQVTPFTFGSGDTITAKFSVPILGWSATQQLSSEVSGRVIAFHALNITGAFTSVPSGVTTAIGNLTVSVDTLNAFDGTEYEIKESGIYEADTQAYATGSGYGMSIGFLADGVFYETAAYTTNGAGNSYGGRRLFQFEAGQKIKLAVNQTSGSAQNVGAYNPTYLKLTKLSSGSQQIADVGTIGARYEYSGSQSFPHNTYTEMVPTAREYDSHGVYNTTTGRYPVPESGLWEIEAFTNLTGATAGTGEMIMVGGIDGALTAPRRMARAPIVSGSDGLHGSQVVRALKGQELSAFFFHSNGATRNSESPIGWVSFRRVGNYV